MTNDVLEEVRAVLHSEPRLGAGSDLELAYDDRALTIEGEVKNVAVKKLLLERAAAHPAVDGIIDRLHVVPAQLMGDGEIRDHLRDALFKDSALTEISIHEEVKGVERIAREVPEARGAICVSVREGVVTLYGEVPSLAHKRLVGVLAWWVPGSRDIVNGLDVVARQQDSDADLTDAVRTALEMDPFVEASQIRVFSLGATVGLHGIVPTESEREMAEFDAWYVFGVDKVENHIAVRPFPPTGHI